MFRGLFQRPRASSGGQNQNQNQAPPPPNAAQAVAPTPNSDGAHVNQTQASPATVTHPHQNPHLSAAASASWSLSDEHGAGNYRRIRRIRGYDEVVEIRQNRVRRLSDKVAEINNGVPVAVKELAGFLILEWVRVHRFCEIERWHDFALEANLRDINEVAVLYSRTRSRAELQRMINSEKLTGRIKATAEAGDPQGGGQDFDLVLQGSWQGGECDGIGYLLTVRLRLAQICIDDAAIERPGMGAGMGTEIGLEEAGGMPGMGEGSGFGLNLGFGSGPGAEGSAGLSYEQLEDYQRLIQAQEQEIQQVGGTGEAAGNFNSMIPTGVAAVQAQSVEAVPLSTHSLEATPQSQLDPHGAPVASYSTATLQTHQPPHKQKPDLPLKRRTHYLTGSIEWHLFHCRSEQEIEARLDRDAANPDSEPPPPKLRVAGEKREFLRRHIGHSCVEKVRGVVRNGTLYLAGFQLLDQNVASDSLADNPRQYSIASIDQYVLKWDGKHQRFRGCSRNWHPSADVRQWNAPIISEVVRASELMQSVIPKIPCSRVQRFNDSAPLTPEASALKQTEAPLWYVGSEGSSGGPGGPIGAGGASQRSYLSNHWGSYGGGSGSESQSPQAGRSEEPGYPGNSTSGYNAHIEYFGTPENSYLGGGPGCQSGKQGFSMQRHAERIPSITQSELGTTRATSSSYGGITPPISEHLGSASVPSYSPTDVQQSPSGHLDFVANTSGNNLNTCPLVQKPVLSPGRSTCSICLDPFLHKTVTPCGHEFCASCICEMLTATPQRDMGACPLCREFITLVSLRNEYGYPLVADSALFP